MDLVGGIIGFSRFAACQSGAVALCGEGAGDGLTDVGTCTENKDDGRRDRHDFQCKKFKLCQEGLSDRCSCFVTLQYWLALDGLLVLVRTEIYIQAQNDMVWCATPRLSSVIGAYHRAIASLGIMT